MECAAFGRTPKQSLVGGLRGSWRVWTGEVDGRAEAMFGVAAVSLMDGLGSPWLLGTDRVGEQAVAFGRMAGAYLATIEKTFPRLENWIAEENVVSRRWLTRLGFDISGEAVDIGGLQMLRFRKGFPTCALPPQLPSQPPPSAPPPRPSVATPL